MLFSESVQLKQSMVAASTFCVNIRVAPIVAIITPVFILSYLLLFRTKKPPKHLVVRRLRTILRIVLLILYTRSPPDPGQEIVFRRNIKTGAQRRALRLYSDAKAEVLTPHSRNTREHFDYTLMWFLFQY